MWKKKMKLKCKKMKQKTKHNHYQHWSSYRRLQMGLGSNPSSQAHLSWPNYQHSTGWSISSLVDSLEMERQSIQSSWTLWLVCHPPRSWTISYQMNVICVRFWQNIRSFSCLTFKIFVKVMGYNYYKKRDTCNSSTFRANN